MEPTTTPQETTCSVCHQSLLPTYYFCPNCGKNVVEVPLPTSVWAQTKLYTISILLPAICFLTIGSWKGITYIRSKDTKAKIIGWAASLILVLSTIITFWYAYVTVEKVIQTATANIGSEAQ